jgi:ribosome-associated protein
VRITSNPAEGAPFSAELDTVRMVVEAALDAKGRDISILEMSEVLNVADFFVIISGRSDRQVQGIINKVVDTLKLQGIKPFAIEGLEDGHWVIADFGSVVVHAFYEGTREYYSIESLWARASRLIVDDVDGSPVIRKAA